MKDFVASAQKGWCQEFQSASLHKSLFVSFLSFLVQGLSSSSAEVTAERVIPTALKMKTEAFHDHLLSVPDEDSRAILVLDKVVRKKILPS